MRIQGRDCTLTVARDGEFIPIPYSEETVFGSGEKSHVAPVGKSQF